MFLFGLEGSGFIIAVALTLLVSGAIMFYCLKRFSVLESAVTDQGKILQSFIQNNQMQNGGLASSVALESAREQVELSNNDDEMIKSLDMNNSLLHHEKIEVSDDDDDSDFEEESDDEQSEEEEEEKLIGEVKEIESVTLENEKSIELNETNLLENLNVEELVISKLVEANVDEKLISSEVIITGELVTNDENLNQVKIEELNIDNESENVINLEKLKVGELRTLAVEKNLVENQAAAGKLKKEELLKLFN